MSDQTIFGGDKPVEPAAVNPQGNPTDYNQYLAMIVNEEGNQKYKTLEEALKGAAHAQTFIGKLQSEKAALEVQLAAAQSGASKQAELERTLQALIDKRETTSASPAAPASFDADAIARLVQEKLLASEAAKTAKANQDAVAIKLVETFGAEHAESKYNEAASALGISIADLNTMSAKSPKLVLKALGVSDSPAASQPTFAPRSSAVNPAAFEQTKETFIRRNDQPIKVGATTRDLMLEAARARSLVDEIHAAGGELQDLADPKVFFKYFN